MDPDMRDSPRRLAIQVEGYGKALRSSIDAACYLRATITALHAAIVVPDSRTAMAIRVKFELSCLG